MKNYYTILGLQPGATREEIKQAYHDMVRIWHPDRFANDPKLQKKVQETLKEINIAYSELKKLGDPSPDPSTHPKASAKTHQQAEARKPKYTTRHHPAPPRPGRGFGWFRLLIIISLFLAFRGWLSQSSPQADKPNTAAPNLPTDPYHYYSVVDYKSSNGVFYTKLQKNQTLDECEEALSEIPSGSLDKKCVRDDGRYDDIFIHKSPRREWYFLVQFFNGRDYAIVLNNAPEKDDAAVASRFFEEVVEELRPAIRKSRVQAYTTLVSPRVS